MSVFPEMFAAERDDSLDGFELFLATTLSNLQSLHSQDNL